MTSIGSDAFKDCSGLSSVTISCKDENDFSNYVQRTDIYKIFHTDGLRGKKHAITIDGTERTNITIPNSVKSIGGSAFSGCSSLTSITIGNSVKSIGGSAFSGCSGLTSITIPNSVTSIGDYAFDGCSSLPIVDNLRYADTYLVEAVNKSLSSCKIKEGTRFIGSNAFNGCSSLTSITIPNSVTSVGNNAFQDCSKLTSITIPNSVTSVGNNAFQDCSKLTSVTISCKDENDFSNYIQRKDLRSVFYQGDLVMKSHIISIGGKDMTSITIPNGVTSIGDYAICNCYDLKSATIPNSVKSIGNYAFSACWSLPSITIPNSVTSIGTRAFYQSKKLTSIAIPNSVTSIATSAFADCTALKTVTINSQSIIENIGDYLKGTSIKDVFGNQVESYILGNSVKSIGYRTFRDCSGLTSVTIPNSVKSIGTYAFYGCTGLTSITIPNSVTSIGDEAFRGCSGLKSITIPNSVTSIGIGAFSSCYRLTSVTIPNARIGNGAFSGCPIEVANVNAEAACSKDVLGTELKKLVIGDDVQSIAGSAFSGCKSLENLTIGENVETLGHNCFDGCSALKEVILGKSLRSIGSGAFGGADRIENIYSLNPVPPTCAGESAFHEYAYKSAVVYVPNERNAIARYKADAVWSKFFEINEKDMTNVGVVIPEYTITTSPEGYATFFSSEAAYALPNGLSAQLVTACSKNKLTYKTIADGSVSGIIPKGTAVMLVSEAKKAGTFKLTPAETATSYTGTNLLHGSDEATTTTASGTNYYYKLTYGEGAESEIFGWYWGAEDGAAFQIDGHKAWLALPKSSVTRSGFALDDETAIEEMMTEEDAVYYDLQGRRIGTPTASGIYIVNGKKVMIKK